MVLERASPGMTAYLKLPSMSIWVAEGAIIKVLFSWITI